MWIISELVGDDDDGAEVHHTSFCERLCGSACGACFGLFLICFSIGLLGWNEFDFVRNHATILMVQQDVVEAKCAPDPSNNGKLVFVSCPVVQMHDFSRAYPAVGKLVNDNMTAIWISANTQIFQYVEEKQSTTSKNSVGGGKTTKTKYKIGQKWVEKAVDESSFHCQSTTQMECQFPDGGLVMVKNSGRIPSGLDFGKSYAPADSVRIGENVPKSYSLNSELLHKVTKSEPFRFKDDPVLDRRKGIKQGTTTLAFPQNPGKTTIGDLRVQLEKCATSGSLSVVAKQGEDGKLVPHVLKKHQQGSMSKINWLLEGEVGKEEFFVEQMNNNSSNTWACRLLGFLLVWLSLYLITKPLEVMPDLIPCIGPLISDIVGCMLCCLNFFIAAALSLTAMAVAWFMARPMYGAIILTAVATLLACACGVAHSAKPEKDGSEAKLVGDQGKAEQGYGTQGYAAPYQVATAAMPVQPGPVQAMPVQAAPAPAVPVQAAIVQAVPIQATPAPAMPVEAATAPAMPVQAAPAPAVPVEAAPVPTVPVAPVAPTQILVTCPEGSAEGSLLQVIAPDGRALQVQVPQGISPGQQFAVMA